MKRSFRSRFPTSFRPQYRPPHSASNRRRRKALRPAVPAGCPFLLRPVRRRRFCAVDLSLSFPRLHRRERRPAAPLLPVISVRSSQKENIHETIVPAQAQKSEFSGNRIAHRQYFRPLLPENRPSSLRLLAGRAPRRPLKTCRRRRTSTPNSCAPGFRKASEAFSTSAAAPATTPKCCWLRDMKSTASRRARISLR